jgi:hypothetical protein
MSQNKSGWSKQIEFYADIRSEVIFQKKCRPDENIKKMFLSRLLAASGEG